MAVRLQGQSQIQTVITAGLQADASPRVSPAASTPESLLIPNSFPACTCVMCSFCMP